MAIIKKIQKIINTDDMVTNFKVTVSEEIDGVLLTESKLTTVFSNTNLITEDKWDASELDSIMAVVIIENNLEGLLKAKIAEATGMLV
jgi:hypothetical protein